MAIPRHLGVPAQSYPTGRARLVDQHLGAVERAFHEPEDRAHHARVPTLGGLTQFHRDLVAAFGDVSRRVGIPGGEGYDPPLQPDVADAFGVAG